MRRAVIWLTIVGLLLGCSSAAQAGWVWRDGRWTYVEPSKPPPTPTKASPKAARKPIPPTPKPDEPTPPTARAPKAPQPHPETAAPKTQTPAPKPETLAPPKAAPPPQTPTEPKEPPETKTPWWKRTWWKREPDPNADKALFDEAKAELDAGRRRTAEDDFKKLIKDYPESACREEAIWLWGGSLFDRREYYKAYEQYEDLITQYAGSVHYRDALLKEIEIAELFLGPARRRILGIPLLSGEDEAIEILRRVYEHQPAGDLADDVVLRIADYYWSKHKWTEADDYYDKYCREYPNGDAILHAELRRAMCAIENCKGPQYDVTGLRLAYDRLRQYQKKFPDEAARRGVPELLVQVRDMQAQSLYEIAARHRRAGQPLAAAFYAERLQERFADSPWNAEAAAFLTPVLPIRPAYDGAGPQTPNDEPETPAEEADRQEPTK
ncbi:MAG TPA: outer membrane protein assembly factor BamD [Phycisphaerae bacterium]|nr:outer membrane protein assembly factor BamD [Phycisphaerae bacterium]